MSVSLDSGLPERRAARRAFDCAAARRAFDLAAATRGVDFAALPIDRAAGLDPAWVVHDETRARLLERLSFFRLEPRVAVDLGCATASGARALAERYPEARVLAIDSSRGMLAAARAACAATLAGAAVSVVGGDAERLPLASGAVQLVLANLVLPWCRPQLVFAEASRVLEAGGLLLFATLGPDSLQEVRRAWGGVDDRLHVHAAFDMHDVGDLALAAGLAEPVLDVDRLELTYEQPAALVRDLRAWGAINVAAGRRRELTGRRRWQAFEERLTAASSGGRFAVTVEVVLGQAWGGGRPRAAASGPAETAVAVERIGHRRGRGTPE
jgi:malonyl-CoA O-methyltransferase